MNRDDELWKGLIEDIFPYFIPFFLPRYQHLFDLERPVDFLDKEFHQLFPAGDGAGLRFVDKLVKLFTKSGEEKWVLIHIEVQGYHDLHFAERMFTYYYRILDRYKVPVTAIAIFTDSSPAYQPNVYTNDFAGTGLTYHFNTYKVLEQDEAELSQSDNPFAIAILTVLLALRKKKLEDANLYGLKIALVRQMKAHNFEQGTTFLLLQFIKKYVRFAKPETEVNFDKESDAIIKNDYNMTTEEIAIKLMREEGMDEAAIEQDIASSKRFAENYAKSRPEIGMRFKIIENLVRSTDFSSQKIAELTESPIEDVYMVHYKLNRRAS